MTYDYVIRRAPGEPVKCDFCSSPDVCWSFPCPDFAVNQRLHVTGIRLDLSRTEQDMNLDWGSSGGWAACEVCARLVIAEKWDKLLTRSAKTAIRLKMLPVSLHDMKKLIAPLHAEFRRLRRGEPIYHHTTPTEDPTR
jgi:hypothetical protein